MRSETGPTEFRPLGVPQDLGNALISFILGLLAHIPPASDGNRDRTHSGNAFQGLRIGGTFRPRQPGSPGTKAATNSSWFRHVLIGEANCPSNAAQLEGPALDAALPGDIRAELQLSYALDHRSTSGPLLAAHRAGEPRSDPAAKTHTVLRGPTMKIALAIAPADALPSAFVVFRDRLEVSIARAASMGYDGIELALGRADQVDPAHVTSLLSDHGMRVSAVSTGRVAAEEKAWLTSSDRAVRARALEILVGLVELSARLGAGRLNIGRVRGSIEAGETLETAEDRFVAGIVQLAARALPYGINIVLEPVNRYELNYVNTVNPDGIRLIDSVGLPNVKLMADVFHMNIEDVSIPGSLMAAGSRVGYVHLADSNRWAPGQGHIDFVAVLAALRQIGYDSWVAVEILPYPTAELAAQEAIKYLRTLVPTAAI